MMHGSIYYKRSNQEANSVPRPEPRAPGGRSRAWLLWWLLGALAAGCAGPNRLAKNAQRVSFAELSGAQRKQAAEKLRHLPTVLYFRKGERIPLDFALDSSLLKLEGTQPELTAKRDCYVLLSPRHPPLLSTDGIDFESKVKNYFMLTPRQE